MALALTRSASAPEFIEQPNAAGLPIVAVLTGGETHDIKAYDDLMEELESDPGALLADKGHDSDAICRDLRDRGTAPEILTKGNWKIRHCVDKALYAIRSQGSSVASAI